MLVIDTICGDVTVHSWPLRIAVLQYSIPGYTTYSHVRAAYLLVDRVAIKGHTAASIHCTAVLPKFFWIAREMFEAPLARNKLINIPAKYTRAKYSARSW